MCGSNNKGSLRFARPSVAVDSCIIDNVQEILNRVRWSTLATYVF